MENRGCQQRCWHAGSSGANYRSRNHSSHRVWRHHRHMRSEKSEEEALYTVLSIGSDESWFFNKVVTPTFPLLVEDHQAWDW